MEGETHATAICVLDLVRRVDGDDDRTTRLPSPGYRLSYGRTNALIWTGSALIGLAFYLLR